MATRVAHALNVLHMKTHTTNVGWGKPHQLPLGLYKPCPPRTNWPLFGAGQAGQIYQLSRDFQNKGFGRITDFRHIPLFLY